MSDVKVKRQKIKKMYNNLSEYKADLLVSLPNHSYCSVCELDNQRNSMNVDGVTICSECVQFLGGWEEINKQVKYIKETRLK